jgi:hypothetical protein
VVLLAFVAACGPTYEEKSKKEDAVRAAAQTAEREAQEAKKAKLRDQFQAVEFPGSHLSGHSFTYDIQQFFAAAAGKPVLFTAYTEDIEAAGKSGGVIAEFTAPIGAGFLDRGIPVRLRLTATAEQVASLLARHKPRGFFSNKSMQPTDTIVVARIERTEPARLYQIGGDATEGSARVDLSLDTSPEVLATGTLVAVEAL